MLAWVPLGRLGEAEPCPCLEVVAVVDLVLQFGPDWLLLRLLAAG